MFKRFASVFVMVGTILAVLVTPAMAAGKPGQPPGLIRGVVLVRNKAANSPGPTGGDLVYNGGPVMHANRTYTIYWIPSGFTVAAGYRGLINHFLYNVAVASGKTNNVYYSDTQYYDTLHGYLLYKSAFAGSVLDTRTFPANGCSDPYTKVCLSDGQLQNEINRIATAYGWSRSGAIFFILTPKGVSSCASGACAFSDFCAYHSDFQAKAGDTLYADIPYAMTVPSACSSGQSPNDNAAADSAINLISHEHNETITDPLGTAWYNYYGYEDGDLCAWGFGSALGSTAYGEYNQVIGSGKYYIQSEWSNYSGQCVLKGW